MKNSTQKLLARLEKQEAITAAKEGNFGVGAVLVGRSGKIIQKGHNRMFNPYFRSVLHAEMDIITRTEERLKNTPSFKDFVLFTSLEPCPMCFTRLISSGVGKVYYRELRNLALQILLATVDECNQKLKDR